MSKLPIHRAAKPKIKDKLTRGLGNLPRVEILRPWRGYAVGAIIRPPGVLRQVLVDKGYGALVVDKPKRGRPKKVVEAIAEKEEKIADVENPDTAISKTVDGVKTEYSVSAKEAKTEAE